MATPWLQLALRCKDAFLTLENVKCLTPPDDVGALEEYSVTLAAAESLCHAALDDLLATCEQHRRFLFGESKVGEATPAQEPPQKAAGHIWQGSGM